MTPDPAQERLYQRSWRRFVTGYRMRPPVTLGLVVALVAIHLYTGWVDVQLGLGDAFGIIFGARSERVLAEFGARSTPLVQRGEIWRLWTHGFLHANALHIFFNVSALWGLGRVCEAVYGSTRTFWLFLVSVIGGGLLSQLFTFGPSVGASGGLFGLMGALLVFGQRRRRFMDPPMRAAFGRRLLPWVVLNLGIGVFVPNIDNYAHIGGLVAGAGFALVADDVITADQDGPTFTLRAMRVASAALLASGLVGVLYG